MLFFGNNCCFFIQISIFTWMNVQDPEKSTFVAKKQHFCCKKATMMLCCYQHQIHNHGHMMIIQIKINPKSLDFRKISISDNFWKSTLSIVYGLSNITNWQQFCGGPLWQQIYGFPPPHNSIFIWGADFFQVLIKSTVFGNKNNKYCF